MSLLDKLKQSQKKVKKELKQNLNINSAFGTLSDDEIAMVLALRSKNLRILNNKKQKEFSNEIKLSSSTTYSNFEQSGKISLINFIKIIRGLGRFDEFENLLKPTISQEIDGFDKVRKKRVR